MPDTDSWNEMQLTKHDNEEAYEELPFDSLEKDYDKGDELRDYMLEENEDK